MVFLPLKALKYTFFVYLISTVSRPFSLFAANDKAILKITLTINGKKILLFRLQHKKLNIIKQNSYFMNKKSLLNTCNLIIISIKIKLNWLNIVFLDLLWFFLAMEIKNAKAYIIFYSSNLLTSNCKILFHSRQQIVTFTAFINIEYVSS